MIESMWLKNFRRHNNLKIDFDAQFNVISGRNNAGKTTLLYAIEYCLFGITSGFKKISQLVKIGEKEVGVQLIIRNRKNERFKLQRMHTITSKTGAAKGFFTLKQLTDQASEEGKIVETYILSSDFGDREEQLSLRLNEILGISKRVFQTVVIFNQGMIPEILIGSPKLDIVFGLTATSALIDVFSSRASTYAKESQEIDRLELQYGQSRQEKLQLEQRIEELQTSLKKTKTEISIKESYLDFLRKSKEDISIVAYVIDNYRETQKNIEEGKYRLKINDDEIIEFNQKNGTLDEIDSKLTTLQNNLHPIQKEIISIQKDIEEKQPLLLEIERKKINLENQIKERDKLQKQLLKFIDEFGSTQNITQKRIEELEKSKSLKSRQEFLNRELDTTGREIRDLERKRGDLEGILQRRRSNANNQTCEYCGATIDSSKIAQEITDYSNQLTFLNTKLSDIEKNIETYKHEISDIGMNLNQIDKKVREYDKKLETLENYESKLNQYAPVADLNKNYEAYEIEINKIQSELQTKKEKQTILQSQNIELTTSMNLIETLKERLLSLLTKKETIEALNTQLNTRIVVARENIIAKFNELAQKYANIQIKAVMGATPDDQNIFREMQNQFIQIAKKLSITNESFDEKSIIEIRDEFRDFILSKTTEFTTTITHYKSQIHEYEQRIRENEIRIMAIDKDIAYFQKKIQLLVKKKQISNSYFEYSHILQEIQNQIREQAVKSLQDKILEYDRILSVDDEFKAVHVNPDDYSLSISPKDVAGAEFFPAWLFEGGGHKLILALAYKIALGDIIGKPPFLLIDEPTEFMDKENRSHLMKNIHKILDQSQIFLITHQDVDLIQANKKITIKRT
jgi:DNA repair exonuclease SbcCD ATPase subunit